MYRYLTGSTESHYLAWVKRSGFQSESLTLKDGTKVFWVGRPNTDYVVLYFHGIILSMAVRVAR
jgi:hypothetical protein